MEWIAKLLGKRSGEGKKEQLYVTGSGLVSVSEGRMNEIPRVIAEYHDQEAERAKTIASIRRV